MASFDDQRSRWTASVRPVLVMALLALAVSACSAVGSSDRGSGRAADQIVRIAAPADPWPDQGRGDRSTTFAYPLNFNVYEPLVSLASDYTLRPGLAERWEFVAPGTWRFYLRRGVSFSNGKAFTADDVMWSWAERQATGQSLRSVTSVLGPNTITKVDDFTVDFTPVVPDNRLPEQLSHPSGGIVARGSHFDSMPAVGTGPFRVVSYLPEELLVLERNDAYWGPKPATRRLIVRFFPDRGARVEALDSGDADVALDVASVDLTDLSVDGGYRIVKAPPGRTHQVFIRRNGDAITTDRAVRQAVSLALDRNRYAASVVGQEAEPGRLMAPLAVVGPASSLVPPLDYNVAQARGILDAAGWSEGPDGIRAKPEARLTLLLLAHPDLSDDTSTFIRRSLRDAGIEVLVTRPVDLAERDRLLRAEAFDLDLEDTAQNDGNPAFSPLLSMYSKSPGSQPFAPGGSFDVLAEMALATPGTQDAQRAAAQMMQILVTEENVVVPLAAVSRLDALGPGIRLDDPHPSLTNQSWVTLGTRLPR